MKPLLNDRKRSLMSVPGGYRKSRKGISGMAETVSGGRLRRRRGQQKNVSKFVGA